MPVEDHSTDRGGESPGAPVMMVGMTNFTTDVLESDRPVLLLCMPRDPAYEEQIRIMAGLARQYVRPLRVGLLEQGFIGAFRQEYGVKGTPTFFIFHEGDEQGRLLGQADLETLVHFINTHLTDEGLIRED